MNVKTWKMCGPAGFGIMSAGPGFAKVLKRSGYSVQGYPEYPSIIRGGYNSFTVSFSNQEVFSTYKKIDVLVVLDPITFSNEKVDKDTVVIADFKNYKDAESLKCVKIDIPFKDILKERNLPDIVKNSVALGASTKLFNLDFELLKSVLKEIFPAKVFDINVSAAEMGAEFCTIDFKMPKVEPKFCDHIFISGNESIVNGSIAAGLGFYSTYPMTPASSILHYLAQVDEKYGIIVKHAEDEIAGVNMAIGASYTGVRAMTGTSGGGLSLMTEGIGLAAITETPLVIVVSQRPGPATGMPTWTEQGDLKFVMNISQGEFPRIVLTPGDVEELFYWTFEAFNLADKFQVPVFVMSDKFLSESFFSSKKFNTDGLKIDRGFIFKGDEDKPMEFYPRYREFENGVPMKSNPGTPGGLHKAPGNEHDDFGFVATDSATRIKNQERRFKKELFIKDFLPKPALYGNQNAQTTFVCWGSTKVMLLEALKYTDKFNFIHFPAVHPIDWEYVKRLFESRNLVIVEQNFTGQLKSIVAEKTGVIIERVFLKYDGRPFFVEEIIDFVNGGENEGGRF